MQNIIYPVSGSIKGLMKEQNQNWNM